MLQARFIAILLAAGLIAACSGGSDGSESTSTAAATATALPTDTATPEPTPEPIVCTFGDAARQAVGPTVQVVTDDGVGTAFHVGDGVFVTAAHVVADTDNVWLLSTDLDTRARVTAVDEEADVATLLADLSLNPDFPAFDWGDSSTVSVGQEVGISGYPPGVFGGDSAIARGTVSRVFSAGGYATIQTDTAVNPGNSGGPLFNECGNVVGVVVAKLSETSIEGIGYAITESSARFALDLPATFVAANPLATASPPSTSTPRDDEPLDPSATPSATSTSEPAPAATQPPSAPTTQPTPASPPSQVVSPPVTLTGAQWMVTRSSGSGARRVWQLSTSEFREWDIDTYQFEPFEAVRAASNWSVNGSSVEFSVNGRTRYRLTMNSTNTGFSGTWTNETTGASDRFSGSRLEPLFAVGKSRVLDLQYGTDDKFLVAGSDSLNAASGARFELIDTPTKGTLSSPTPTCSSTENFRGTTCFAVYRYDLTDLNATSDSFSFRFWNAGQLTPVVRVTISITGEPDE